MSLFLDGYSKTFGYYACILVYISVNMDANLPCKEAGLLVGHQGPVRSVRFNSDGNYCMTCGSDKLVKLWNPHRQDGKLLKTYGGHGYEVLDVVASGDSSRLASCSVDRTIVLWDVTTGQVIRRYRGHIAKVNCVRFNQPDSTVIMSASYDATIRCWDTRSRSQDPIQVIDDAKDSIPTLQVSKQEILTGSVDGKVRNYDIRMGSMVVDSLDEPVTSVMFSQDGQCILVSTLDNCIRLLDKETGELLNEFKGHKNQDYKIDSCFTQTDTHILSGSEDGSIYFWDLIEAKVVKTIEKAHTSVSYSLSYHPKEACLMSASADGAVKVWRPIDWEPEEK